MSALALLAGLSACMHQHPPAAPEPHGAAPPAVTPSPPAPADSAPPAAVPATAPPSPPAASAPAATASAPAPPAASPPGASPAAGPSAGSPPAPKPKPAPPPATAAPEKTTPEASAPGPGGVTGKPAPPAAAAPSLDLTSLEQRLRDTRAIGVFTKLSLKNQVDDLLGQFRAYHNGHPKPTLADLRQRYELLLLKVVTLLQDGDAPLASAVSSSREAIWVVLTDPKKFAQI